jgi:cytochrome c-type biogenesis protein CcmH/NrfG
MSKKKDQEAFSQVYLAKALEDDTRQAIGLWQVFLASVDQNVDQVPSNDKERG